MLIDCPGCAKSYHIIKAALGPNGRRVACPRCDTIWFVAGSAKPLAPALAAPIEVPLEEMLRPLYKIASPANPKQRAAAPSGFVSFLKNICAGMAILAFGMALIGFRADIVQLLPMTGRAYAALGLPVNLSGLELRDLHTISTSDATGPVIDIAGEIANTQARDTDVPPIALSIRDGHGETLYSWMVSAQKLRLAAGQVIPFHARLAEPPATGREVIARFATAESERLASH